MSKTAIYPGTFDPITQGHFDLIQRAVDLFDKVIIGVATNPHKAPLLSFEERLRLVEVVTKNMATVRVLGFDNLLIDFARAHQAHVLIRGVRNGSDFDYERQLAEINQQLAADVETIFLLPRPMYACITASFVRDIARCQGDLSAFVHPEVARVLQTQSASI